MICPKCGQANLDTNRFCASCGQSLATDAREGASDLTADPGAQAHGYRPPPAPGIEPTFTVPLYAPLPAPQQPSVYPAYNAPPVVNAPGYPLAVGVPTVAPQQAPYGAPLYGAPAVNVCRVCGTAVPNNQFQCSRCGAPVGMIANPNDPTSSSYLPLNSQSAYYNTSGQKGYVHPEVERMNWSWGAFGTNFIWLFAHGMVGWGLAVLLLHIFLLFLLPFALIASIYLGVNGNRLAWQNRRYESLEDFHKTERVWMRWGIVGFCCYLIASISSVKLIMDAVNSGLAGR